ncbi:MAG: hypothetical protein CSA86_03310 [Arcobacter sp.]|nr:MAG: hypothetical protein CSA86_03310 [Arcobacter sp.]
MNDLIVAIKNRTNLTVRLEKKFSVVYYKKPSLFSKLLFKEIKYPDIYFHKGSLSSQAVFLIEKSSLIIVSSYAIKKEIILKLPDLEASKIYVLYPYCIVKMDYDKSIKKEFKNRFHIPKSSKILFFRAKDLARSGLDVLFDILSRMYQDKFTLIIESSSKQITPLKLQMERSEFKFEYLLLEDYENIDELFIASDIFILPTQQKYFATDILKAMYFRNAVFLMESNHASEIVDTFSLIQSAEDRSVSFKVDSLLINQDELKKIQKENEKIAKNYTLEKSVEKISKIILNLFDI